MHEHRIHANEELFRQKREAKRSTSSPPVNRSLEKQSKIAALNQFTMEDQPEDTANKNPTLKSIFNKIEIPKSLEKQSSELREAMAEIKYLKELILTLKTVMNTNHDQIIKIKAETKQAQEDASVAKYGLRGLNKEHNSQKVIIEQLKRENEELRSKSRESKSSNQHTEELNILREDLMATAGRIDATWRSKANNEEIDALKNEIQKLKQMVSATNSQAPEKQLTPPRINYNSQDGYNSREYCSQDSRESYNDRYRHNGLHRPYNHGRSWVNNRGYNRNYRGNYRGGNREGNRGYYQNKYQGDTQSRYHNHQGRNWSHRTQHHSQQRQRLTYDRRREDDFEYVRKDRRAIEEPRPQRLSQDNRRSYHERPVQHPDQIDARNRQPKPHETMIDERQLRHSEHPQRRDRSERPRETGSPRKFRAPDRPGTRIH